MPGVVKLLELLVLLYERALLRKVTWSQAIEAESSVSDDGHFLGVGKSIEYFAPIQRVLGYFASHTVIFYAGCI